MSFNSMAVTLPTTPHIYVKGEATITTMPDYVNLRVAIIEIDKDIIAAKAKVDSTMAKAISLAKNHGVKPKDIQGGSITINRETRYNRELGSQEFAGFRVGRPLSIKLTNLDHYPKLLQSLVNSGINDINSSHFLSSNYNALYKKAQTNAIINAKNTAQEISNEFGVTLKGLYSASQSPMNTQSQPLLRTKMKESGDELVSAQSYHTGEIKITAQTYAIYLIE
jgi:uncharacterized protein YggE